MIVMLTHIVELVLEYLIPVCELMGIFIVAISILTAFATYIRNLFTGDEHDVKVQLASGLAVSLEFKMAAEILKTVLIHNLTELTVLGAVIGLRAQFASTDCPFRMSGAGSSVEAVWVLG